MNINGLQSGWVETQARTIVPPTATASIDIRMVKGNEASDLIQKLKNHIQSQRYHVVEEDPDRETRLKYPRIAKVTITGNSYKASRTSMDLAVSKSVIQMFSEYFHRDPVLLPSLGGSLPIYIFNEILDVPTIGVPIANHDNNQHQPDENIRIGHLWQGIETFAALFMTSKNE